MKYRLSLSIVKKKRALMLPRSSKLCTPTAGDWVLKPATRSTASWSLKSPLRVQRWIKIGKRNCSHLLSLPHPGWSLLAGFMSTAVPGYLSHMQNINIYNTFFQTLVCMSKLALSLSSLITEAFWPLRGTFGRWLFFETPGFLSNTPADLQLLQLYP